MNTWRDQLKPTQLLQNIARFKGYAPPVFSENGRRITYGGRDYTLEEVGELVHLLYMSLLNSHWYRYKTSPLFREDEGGKNLTLVCTDLC